jgi:cellobiose phosphorylase
LPFAKYKVEPYVIAADVYAVAPHTGRGGWTWYTGSAGWMQRLIIESLLGVSVQGNQLRINPCVPKDWDRYSVSYQFKSSTYLITVIQLIGENESTHLSLDGVILENGVITMVDDLLPHEVELKITRRSI